MALEYKVLTQKDKWFSGKFDPQALENALNAYGDQGWTVVAGDSATFPGWGSNREEIVTILARGQGAAMHEYKVLTQKDKWFSGKFDPAKLEGALNAYAEQGWSVMLATTGTFPGFLSGNREELIVILGRKKG